MRRRAAVAAAILVLLAPLPLAARKRRRRPAEPTPVPRPADSYRVTIATKDGVLLAASWRPVPSEPGAPAVLLLNDFSRERREWEPLAPDFERRGLATLAVDLRGHGESIRRSGGGRIAISPKLLADPGGFPRDVDAACAWLRTHTGKVGVLGLSLGGNLAVLATASGEADAGVAVSASRDRLDALAGKRPTRARAILFLAAEADPGRAESARAFLTAAAEPKRLLLFAGPAHDLQLFLDHPEAKTAALDWLAAQLGAVLPPAPAAPEPSAPRPSPRSSFR